MTFLDELKGKVREAVDEQRDRLREISGFIYENPELGSEEFKSAELLTYELESHGFQVERQLHGIPTAFCATYKGKAEGPRIAVIAEYDALPGVGHGCGHNLISAAAVGAGVAASRVMEQLDGEVLVVGTPAEEGIGPSAGSKVILAKKGFWGDVDAAMMCHPSSIYSVGTRLLGIWRISMEFEGQTAHTAVDPHSGVNALNAATLAYIGTHMLRQEARRDANLVISGIITEGGLASNIIPDRAVCNFGVRSSDEAYLEEMVEKVAKCAEGAALATGAKVKVKKRRVYSSKKQNPPLIDVLWGNYAAQGLEIEHWKETYTGMPLASSDFGDVSHVIPVVSSNIKIGEPGLPGHSVQMADATMTEQGQEAMMVGAKALGMTLVELLAVPEKLKAVKEYFDAN